MPMDNGKIKKKEQTSKWKIFYPQIPLLTRSYPKNKKKIENSDTKKNQVQKLLIGKYRMVFSQWNEYKKKCRRKFQRNS